MNSKGSARKGQKRPLPNSSVNNTIDRFFVKRVSRDVDGSSGDCREGTVCETNSSQSETLGPFIGISNGSPVGDGTSEGASDFVIDNFVSPQTVSPSSEKPDSVDTVGCLHVQDDRRSVSQSDSDPHIDDVGEYAGKGKQRPNDYTLHLILTKRQMQLDPLHLPFSVHMKQGKEEKRYLRQSHLSDPRFSGWLVYSERKGGLFCKYCVFFVPGNVRGGTCLQNLVTEPVTTYAKILGADGYLENHMKTKYHIEAVLAGQDFLRTYSDPKADVSNQLESCRLSELEDKRLSLIPLAKTVILCGRQGLSLRGHRDSGRLTMQSPEYNDGNLRALLRFRADAGDGILCQKLSDERAKLRYISPQHQNKLIHICGEEIRDQLRAQIQEAKFFSIISDETTDIGHISQLSLVIRYAHLDKYLREDFTRFLDARDAALAMALGERNEEHELMEAEADEHDDEKMSIPEPVLSGEVLGKIALDAVDELGLSIDYCVGVGTDSCSTMISEAKGAVTEILKKARHAVRTPCGNHSLNNSLSQSSEVQHVKTTSSVIQQTASFLNSSSKRNIIVRKVMGKEGLTKLCDTRFVERHDAYLQFRDQLPLIVEVLQNVMTWNDCKAASDAKSLLLSITNLAFILTLVCMCDLFSVTLPLACLLQKPTLDVQTASDHVNDVLNTLEEKRLQADDIFSMLFMEASEMAEKLGCEITVPPRAFRSVRSGHPTNNDPEIYYRQAIYIPIYDTVLQDLKERFPKQALDVYGLTCLLPSYLVSSEFTEEVLTSQLATVTEKYWSLFGTSQRSFLQLLQGQIILWRSKWSRVDKSSIPKDVMSALDLCDKDIFPFVHGLLKVLASLPVSTCSAERSFSTLRRLKTYLRSTMKADRLTGLALLNIHRNIPVDVDKVVERFLKLKHRNK